MTRNQLFSFCGFGLMAALVLPEADGALDSVGEYQQAMGLYALGAESAAVTVTTSDSDASSWFRFAPSLLPVRAGAPIKGQLLKAMPPVRWRFRAELIKPPAGRVILPDVPLSVWVPIEPQVAEPAIPPALLGIGRAVLPGVTARFEGWMEDPDETLLLLLAAELPPRPAGRYLVERSVVKDEWRKSLAATLDGLT